MKFILKYSFDNVFVGTVFFDTRAATHPVYYLHLVSAQVVGMEKVLGLIGLYSIGSIANTKHP